MEIQNEFGKKLDMDEQNITNVICPSCEKKITAKTLNSDIKNSFEKQIYCEHCGQDLEVEIYKIKNKICVGFDEKFSLFKIKNKGGEAKC